LAYQTRARPDLPSPHHHKGL